MKRFLSLVLVLTLLVWGAVPCFAAANNAANTVSSQGPAGMGTLRTYTLINSDDIQEYDATLIPITTIIPNKCVILGISVVVTGAIYEGCVSIRDRATMLAATDDYIVNEVEATITQPVNLWFTQPLQVRRGVVVRQGAHTCVTIYYMQVRA